MKAYVLLESNLDSREYICGIYLDKNKAELEKLSLEFELSQIKKCDECLCSGGYYSDIGDNCKTNMVEDVEKYCEQASLFWEDSHEITILSCNNERFAYYDGYNYKIQEIEIVE